MNRKALSVLALLVTLLTMTSRSQGVQSDIVITTPFSSGSLRGLTALYVSVEALDPHIEEDGLHREDIQNDVELLLRQSGIKVVDSTGIRKFPGRPTLYINLGSCRNRNIPLYAYTVNPYLEQNVFLQRDLRTMVVSVITWRSPGRIGMCTGQSVRAIRDIVKDEVSVFINAYLEANPK